MSFPLSCYTRRATSDTSIVYGQTYLSEKVQNLFKSIHLSLFARPTWRVTLRHAMIYGQACPAENYSRADLYVAYGLRHEKFSNCGDGR